MCLIPAANCWSLDAKRNQLAPSLPRWSLLALLGTIEIMLVYAGLVKIYPDWLNGLPLSIWLSARTDTPLIGPFLAERWAHLLASWGSIAIHLLGAPALLWRRTRALAFGVYAVFHGLNSVFFNIGIFPLLTIVATTLFFAPSWPRRWLRRVESPALTAPYRGGPSETAVVTLLAAFLIVQTLLPLRHFLYPGDVMWTDEGHRFAWRMKLREKYGIAMFYIRDQETGQTWTVHPRDHLKPRQADKVATRPEFVLQFAHHLKDLWQRDYGVHQADIRAYVACSLNGRPPALLVDPSVNLATQSFQLGPAPWVTRSFTDMPAPQAFAVP